MSEVAGGASSNGSIVSLSRISGILGIFGGVVIEAGLAGRRQIEGWRALAIAVGSGFKVSVLIDA